MESFGLAEIKKYPQRRFSLAWKNSCLPVYFKALEFGLENAFVGIFSRQHYAYMPFSGKMRGGETKQCLGAEAALVARCRTAAVA